LYDIWDAYLVPRVWVDMCSPPRLSTATSHCQTQQAQSRQNCFARNEPKCLTLNTARTGLFDTVKHLTNMVLENDF
jgi:hypothetical protein